MDKVNGIPIMGLGTYQLTGRKCVDAVRTALRIGYRHIDTAVFYRNHEEIGEAIKGFPRHELFLTSKVWTTDLRYEDVIGSCSAALHELSTDYLDLFLIHWPNPSIPLEETMDALAHLKEQGKIKAFGVSNFTIRLMDQAMSFGKIATNQVEFHPYLYQKKLLDFCRQNKIALTAYCPIARAKVFQDPIFLGIARKHNKTPGQISLRWLIEKDIVAIPKASSEDHLKENFDVFDFQLGHDDIKALDNLPQERLVDPGFVTFD
jgi:2,5-diketo-D-gluconate reductase B